MLSKDQLLLWDCLDIILVLFNYKSMVLNGSHKIKEKEEFPRILNVPEEREDNKWRKWDVTVILPRTINS